jgi:hypothetical protein
MTWVFLRGADGKKEKLVKEKRGKEGIKVLTPKARSQIN